MNVVYHPERRKVLGVNERKIMSMTEKPILTLKQMAEIIDKQNYPVGYPVGHRLGESIARSLVAAGVPVADEPKTPGLLFAEEWYRTGSTALVTCHEYEEALGAKADQYRNATLEEANAVLRARYVHETPSSHDGVIDDLIDQIEALKTK
jgi:hypothetical protein